MKMCMMSQENERSLKMHYFDVERLNKSTTQVNSRPWIAAVVVGADGEMVPLLFGEASEESGGG